MSDARIDAATQSYNNFSHDPYVFDAQTSLNKVYGEGTVQTSGYLDANTESALKQFQRDAGLPQTGRADAKTLDALANPSSQGSHSPVATSAQASAQQADNMLRASIVKTSANGTTETYAATGTNARGELHTQVGAIRVQSRNMNADIATAHVTFDPGSGNTTAHATFTGVELKTNNGRGTAKMDILAAEGHYEVLDKHGERGSRLGGSMSAIEFELASKAGPNSASLSIAALGVGASAGAWVRDEDADGHPEVCVEGTLKLGIGFDFHVCEEVDSIGMPELEATLAEETLAAKKKNH